MHSNFHELDLYNLIEEVEEHHKHFIHEYSHLNKTREYNSDIEKIRDSRRGSLLHQNSNLSSKSYFTEEELALSL